MDRSLYISYTIILDKCILAQNRHSFLFFYIILYTYHKYTPIKFLAPLRGGNRCFMLISILSASLVLQTFFLCIFWVVFEFLILFVFFFAEIFSLHHNGSFHQVDNSLALPNQQLGMRQMPMSIIKE